MSKFIMWWSLKGQEKTKKIIGRICRWLCTAGLGFIVASFILGAFIIHGWIVAIWFGGLILAVLIVSAAIFWGDK